MFYLASVALLAALAQDVPSLTGRVVDNAHILSDAARARVTAASKAHEDATTNQVVVLTVPTIGSDSIENYANTVFHAWRLGQKGKDNGVLVVVAANDRKMRIEVGYGLEGTIPDGAAGEIIRTWMTPAFKAGNYDKGVEDGVAAIIARLAGTSPPPVPVSSPPIKWSVRLLLGVFIFGVLGLFTVVGIMTPGVGWFMYVFLIPFYASFPIVILGLRPTLVLIAVYLIAYPLVKLSVRKKPWYLKAQRETKTSPGSASGWGVFSGSGSSSGGDDGGFSGGGGDSGGGGASGSW